MTVREHLELGSRAWGHEVEEALRRAAAYGLEPWLDHLAAELSTGNARRLWIVVSTLGDGARLVLLDEPFEGLDEASSMVLADEISSWGRDAGVVLITHHLPRGVEVAREVRLPSAGLLPGR